MKVVPNMVSRLLCYIKSKVTSEAALDELIQSVALARLEATAHRVLQQKLLGTSPPGLLALYLKSGWKDDEYWYATLRASEQSFHTLGLPINDMVILNHAVEQECNIYIEDKTYVQLVNMSINAYVELVKKTYLKHPNG